MLWNTMLNRAFSFSCKPFWSFEKHLPNLLSVFVVFVSDVFIIKLWKELFLWWQVCGFHLLECIKLIIWKHSFPRHLIYIINVLVEVTNVIFVEIRNEGGGAMAAWIWGCQISHINRLHFSIFSNLTKSVNNYLCKRYVVFFSFRYAEICHFVVLTLLVH